MSKKLKAIVRLQLNAGKANPAPPVGPALAGQVIFEGQRVVDRGKLSRKFDVHDRADDLNDFAFAHVLKIQFLN